MELLGPEGLLSQVTKAALERALTDEMTGHLGYEKRGPADGGSGNGRNGISSKTLLTLLRRADRTTGGDQRASLLSTTLGFAPNRREA